MPFDGGGTFARIYNWIVDRDAGVKIRADRMDAEMDGFATGLSGCITKDGQTTVTANIPMNTKKFTGLAPGTANGDSVSYSQWKDASGALTSAGSANAYTLATNSTAAALVAGQAVSFKANFSNTAAATLNVTPSGGAALGAKPIRTDGNIPLMVSAIQSGGHYLFQYDVALDVWILLNPSRLVIAGNFYVRPIYATNLNNQIIFDVGTGGAGISINGYRQNGTTASPTAVLSGDEIGFFQLYGWDGSAFNSATFPLALVGMASQDFTPSHAGSGWLVQSISHGTTAGQNEVYVQDGLTALAAGNTGGIPGKGIGTVWAKNGFYQGASGTLGALQSKVITATRALNASSASVAYTGVGFKPTSLIVISATATSSPQGSWTMIDSGLTHQNIGLFDSNKFALQSAIVLWDNATVAGGTNQSGIVSSFDADGFTISWTKNGTPAAVTTTFMVLCLR